MGTQSFKKVCFPLFKDNDSAIIIEKFYNSRGKW